MYALRFPFDSFLYEVVFALRVPCWQLIRQPRHFWQRVSQEKELIRKRERERKEDRRIDMNRHSEVADINWSINWSHPGQSANQQSFDIFWSLARKQLCHWRSSYNVLHITCLLRFASPVWRSVRWSEVPWQFRNLNRGKSKLQFRQAARAHTHRHIYIILYYSMHNTIYIILYTWYYIHNLFT